MAGDAVAIVALPFVLIEAGYGAASLGLVMTTVTASRLIGSLIAGPIADRVRRDRLMAMSDLARAGCEIGAFIVFVTHTHILPLVLVLYGCFGLFAAFFVPAANGMLAEIVESSHKQAANAYLAIVDNFSSTAGPALTGLVFLFVSVNYGVLTDAATFVLSGLLVLRLRLPRRQRGSRTGSPSLFREVVAGIRVVSQTVWLRDGMLLNSAINALGFAPFLILMPYVSRSSSGESSVWGVLFGAYGIGALIGSMLAVRLHPRRPLVSILGCCVVSWVLVFALSPTMSSNPWLLVLPVGMAGACTAVRGIVWDTTLQSGIPQTMIGRISSLDFLTSSVVIPLGYSAFGALGESLGPSRALLASGISLFVIGGVICGKGGIAKPAASLIVIPRSEQASASTRAR